MGNWVMGGQAILREGRMAIRRFPAHLAANIVVESADQAAEAESFEILLDYLLGCNAAQQPVVLHAPVAQCADDEWQLTEKAAPGENGLGTSIRFDFPVCASAVHFPEPTDPRIQLRTVAPRCCATVWFAGAPSGDRVVQEAGRLRDFVAIKGFSANASFAGCGIRTERFGPLNALTRISIPVSDWRAGDRAGIQRPAFRRPVAQNAHALGCPDGQSHQGGQ